MRDVVYGGMDGILSAFNFLIILQTAHIPSNIILWVLILKLFSDGVSLGISNYTGTDAHNDIIEKMEDPNKNGLKTNPALAGVLTMIGFMVFGMLPILIYHCILHDSANLVYNIGLILIVIFVFGMLQGAILTHNIRGTVIKGGELVIVGIFGISISIMIGMIIRRVAGKHYME